VHVSQELLANFSTIRAKWKEKLDLDIPDTWASSPIVQCFAASWWIACSARHKRGSPSLADSPEAGGIERN
jgi:hypothetical protein